MSDDQLEKRNDALISRYLWFYEQLRLKTRSPKTAAQRQFQDVAWGKAKPQTEHEHAYVAYLKKKGRPPGAPVILHPQKMDQVGFPQGARPVPSDVGRKWDAAAENMSRWRPWHD